MLPEKDRKPVHGIPCRFWRDCLLYYKGISSGRIGVFYWGMCSLSRNLLLYFSILDRKFTKIQLKNENTGCIVSKNELCCRSCGTERTTP